MSIQISPRDAALGAAISGIDLSQTLDSDTVENLRNAWHEHIVLIFHDQNLTDPQLLDFTRYFGALEYPPQQTPELFAGVRAESRYTFGNKRHF